MSNINENIGELKGLLASARQQKLNVVIIRIPVRLMTIDPRYQTPIRTERELNYLIKEFDERKLLPVMGVPHDEEGLVYLFDGNGRRIVTQMIDPVKYETLECMVILNAPTDPGKRLQYEAEQYAYQNKNVAKVTPLQKHGALEVLGDRSVLLLDKMQKKYNFSYVTTKGKRSENVLGSYVDVLSIAKSNGENCLEFIFSIISKSGLDRKSNGYASYIVRALRDVWKLYAEDRNTTQKYLVKYFRKINPSDFKAEAQVKYPVLDARAACSLYVEDLIVEHLNLEQSREIIGTKVVMKCN